MDINLDIEVFTKTRFWVCTGTDAACDVLTGKFIETQKGADLPGFLRLRPSLDERLSDDAGVGQLQAQMQTTTLKSEPSSATTGHPSSAIDATSHEPQKHDGSVRPMSLDAMVRKRSDLVRSTNFQEVYIGEKSDLRALKEAREAVRQVRLRDDDLPTVELQEQEIRLREQEIQCLCKLHTAYTANTMGIFSTDAAADNPFMEKFAAQCLIMDDSSRIIEARAASALARVWESGKLRRILMIGDPHQLPPTQKAQNNPFSQNVGLSLFERLILAGTPCVRF